MADIGIVPCDRSSDEEIMITRLLEKAIRRSEAVDREALCIVAGEKVRRGWFTYFVTFDGCSSPSFFFP